MNYLILIFQSTHHVLKAEKIFLGKGLKFDIIPTPKEVSSDCGMSIRINPDVFDANLVTSLLEESKIDFKLFEKWMN
jgi:hypothetical protein